MNTTVIREKNIVMNSRRIGISIRRISRDSDQ